MNSGADPMNRPAFVRSDYFCDTGSDSATFLSPDEFYGTAILCGMGLVVGL